MAQFGSSFAFSHAQSYNEDPRDDAKTFADTYERLWCREICHLDTTRAGLYGLIFRNKVDVFNLLVSCYNRFKISDLRKNLIQI